MVVHHLETALKKAVLILARGISAKQENDSIPPDTRSSTNLTLCYNGKQLHTFGANKHTTGKDIYQYDSTISITRGLG